MRQFASLAAMLTIVFLEGAASLPGQPASEQQTPSAGRPTASPQDAATLLKTEQERTSYALGWDIGRNSAEMFKQHGIAVNLVALFRGIQHGFTGQQTLLPEEQCFEILAKVGEQIQQNQVKQFQALAATNKAEGEKFLAANGKKQGVTTLPSGLQIEVLKQGSGKQPKPSDTVTTHYHGTLLDGSVFDSSVARKEPATFPVSRVIKGWQEALVRMKEGDKWRLYVPADLAYGEQGMPPAIGPNAALIFEVELIKVN